MPVNHTELLTVAQTLAEDENLQVAVKESLKGGCIAAGGAIMGGLLAGPVGLAIGGAVCSIYAAVRSSGKFKSVASIIMEDLTPAQRNQLATSLQRALRDIQIMEHVDLDRWKQHNMTMFEMGYGLPCLTTELINGYQMAKFQSIITTITMLCIMIVLCVIIILCFFKTQFNDEKMDVDEDHDEDINFPTVMEWEVIKDKEMETDFGKMVNQALSGNNVSFPFPFNTTININFAIYNI